MRICEVCNEKITLWQILTRKAYRWWTISDSHGPSSPVDRHNDCADILFNNKGAICRKLNQN